MKKRFLAYRLLTIPVLLLMVTVLLGQQASNLPEGFVYPSGRVFMTSDGADGGTPFYFSGTNNYYLMYKPMEMVEDVLNDMVYLGQKAVRMWLFMDGQAYDGYGIQSEPGVYDESTMEHIDEVMVALAQRGLKAVPVFINYWSDFGGMNQYATWAGSSSNDFYSDPTCQQIYEDYITMWANRVNTVTGVAYKDDPTILSWQLTNEARATSANLDDMLTWVRDMSDHLRTQDPNHMITLGDEGFFNYAYSDIAVINESLSDYQITSDWTYAGSNGDWETVIQMPNISYGTVHNYATDNWGYTVEWGETWTKYHIDIANKYNVPCVMEEYDKAYSGTWTSEADLERAEVLAKYQTIIRDWNMAGDMSWMLVGRNYTDPVEDGYTMDNTAPVEEIWLYRVKWPGDGHQYSRYDTYTGPLLKAHCDLMNAKSGNVGPLKPIADAGDEQTIIDSDQDETEFVTLDGTGSFDPDGDISSYVWSLNGTQLDIGSTVTVSLPVGTHSITLTVTDEQGETGFDIVNISVLEGGARVFEAEIAALTGNSSVVDDATASNGQFVQMAANPSSIVFTIDNVPASLTYPVSILYRSFDANAENGSKNEFVTSSAGGGTIDHVFAASSTWRADILNLPLDAGSNTITIEGSWGYIEIDNISIEGIGGSDTPLNQAPIAEAGNDQTATDSDDNGSEIITLDGSESNDPDGTITQYIWVEDGVQIATGETENVVLDVGTHTIQLTVIDDEGASASDYVTITVSSEILPNQAPVANAGPDQTVTDNDDNGCEDVTLDASLSTDDRGISLYQWFENSTLLGEGVTLTHCFSVESHSVLLTVTDTDGVVDSDELQVTVNEAPVNNVNIALNKQATVSSVDGYAGGGAEAVDGDLNTRWASAWNSPEYLEVDLLGNYNINKVVIAWETAYSSSYQIQVSDNATTWTEIYSTSSANGGTDELVVAGTGRYIRLYCSARATQWGNSVWEFEVYGTLNGEQINLAPIANAGVDQSITDTDDSGTELVTLNGTASYDEDGSITSYIWTEDGTEIESGATATVDLTVGTHNILLTVMDDAGATSSDEVVVTIQAHSSTECGEIAEWDPTVTYRTSNIQVYYNGVIYANKWWTQGQNPEENSDQWDVWYIVGNCSDLKSASSSESISGINSLEVYPNPVIDFINIEFRTENTIPTEIQVYSNIGHLIYNRNLGNLAKGNHTFEMNLKGELNLSSGLYFIKIANDNTYQLKPIIVE